MTAATDYFGSRWSAPLYVGYFVLTVLGAVTTSAAPTAVAVALLLIYLLIETPRVPLVVRVVGLLLCVTGLGAGSLAGDLIAVAFEGMERGLQFLVLFAAVATLRQPALTSPSMRAVGEHIVSQPPGRRFLALELGSHIFGSVLNLAGMQLVGSAAERQTDPELRRRMALAVMRGFSAAPCWSPLFVSTAVVLSVSPGLTWTSLAPMGLFAGVVMLATAWSVDRLSRGSPPPAVAAEPVSRPSRPWLGVAAMFLSLIVPVIALVELSHVGIAIAIGLVGPVVAFLWLRMLTPDSNRSARAYRTLRRELWLTMPALRAEALLFVGASLLGGGLARLLAGTEIGIPVPTGDAAILGILLVNVTLGLAGLHPVIPVIVIGQAMTAEQLGLTPAMIAVSMMASWGPATIVSPLSGTALFVGRLMGLPVSTVAWRWNALYGFGVATVVGLALVLARHVVGW